MKLSELLLEQTGFLTDPQQIIKWLKANTDYDYYDFNPDIYKIHPDGVVDVDASVKIGPTAVVRDKKKKSVRNVPVKFGKIRDDFVVAYNEISDSSFFPSYVGGQLRCDSCNFKTITVPLCTALDLDDNQLTEFPIIPAGCSKIIVGLNNDLHSLIGVADKVGKMKRNGSADTQIILTTANITEGGLGLVLIEGLDEILDNLYGNMTEPFKIISKYIGKPDDVFECQAILLEHGFDAHAQL